MKEFYVAKNSLLMGAAMGPGKDFSFRGFPCGQAEAMGTLTVTVSSAELWTPAQITTALWLDAADSSTITLNGSTVIQWSDKSGNGRHVTQDTDSLRPTLGTNKIVFGGSNWLQNATVQLPLDAFVCAIVFKETTATINAGCFSIKATGADWNSTDGLFFGPSSKSDKRTSWIGRGGDLQVDDTSSPASASPLAVYTINKLLTSALFYRDGNQISTDTFTALSPLSKGGIVLGARALPSVGSPYLRGEIMEIVYAPAVDQQKLDGYLAHKWDTLLGVTTLVSALPSDHPYKSAPPTVSAAGVEIDPYWDQTVLCINADAGIVDAKGHPLSVVGGVTVSTTLGYPTLLFNGSNGYLTSPDSEDWFYGSGPLTIEAWVQPLSLTYVMILGQLQSTSSNNDRFLVGQYDGVLSVFCSTTTTAIDSQAPAAFSTGSMQYYAVKFVDGYVSFWLNGVMQGSPVATSGSVHNISGSLYIGALRYANAMRYLNGHMRGLRITRANRDVSVIPSYPFPTS